MLARLRRSPSLRSFRHRPFRRMAAANLLSITGTWMQMIALSWVVLQLTGSSTALGGSIAVQAAPALVLGLWGGAVVDRTDTRRLLIITQVVLAGLAAVLAVVATGPLLTVGLLYALGLVTGIVHVLDRPANQVFGMQLVGADDLANAAAIGAAINSTGRVVGMSLGGVTVAVAGAGAVFWVNAATYALVALVLLTLPVGELKATANAGAEHAGIRRGLRYLIQRRELVVLVVLSFFLSSFGRNFQVTMAAMTEGAFGLDAAAYGVASTAFAVGGLLGAVYATRLGRPVISAVLLVAGIGSALEAVAGLMPGLRSFSAILVGAGAAAVVLDTVLSTHIQLAVEDAYRGRVLAVLGLFGMGGAAFGAPLLGFLAEVVGPRGALLIGGAVAGAATLIAWLLISPAPSATEVPLVSAHVGMGTASVRVHGMTRVRAAGRARRPGGGDQRHRRGRHRPDRVHGGLRGAMDRRRPGSRRLPADAPIRRTAHPARPGAAGRR